MAKGVVIIEGPDGNGKSKLAHLFEREYGYQYVHTKSPDKPAFEYYNDHLKKYSQGGVVYDRFHPSSFIYGTVFRNGDDLNSYEHWCLDGKLLAQQAVMIYCTTDSTVANTTLNTKTPANYGDYVYEKSETRQEVRDLYARYMTDFTPLPVLHYDYTQDESGEKILKDVDSVLKHFFEYEVFHLRHPFGNIYSPSYCLVNAGYNRYLYTVLRSVGVPINMMCSAWIEPKFDVPTLWVKTKFISFGDDAHKALDKLGILHTAMDDVPSLQATSYDRMKEHGKRIIGDKTLLEELDISIASKI